MHSADTVRIQRSIAAARREEHNPVGTKLDLLPLQTETNREDIAARQLCDGKLFATGSQHSSAALRVDTHTMPWWQGQRSIPRRPPQEKKEHRSHYTFWHQLNEKPSIIPGCPGSATATVQDRQEAAGCTVRPDVDVICRTSLLHLSAAHLMQYANSARATGGCKWQ